MYLHNRLVPSVYYKLFIVLVFNSSAATFDLVYLHQMRSNAPLSGRAHGRLEAIRACERWFGPQVFGGIGLRSPMLTS